MACMAGESAILEYGVPRRLHPVVVVEAIGSVFVRGKIEGEARVGCSKVENLLPFMHRFREHFPAPDHTFLKASCRQIRGGYISIGWAKAFS